MRMMWERQQKFYYEFRIHLEKHDVIECVSVDVD